MRNLAGDPDCDRYIRDELRRCRIGVVDGERSNREVAASVTGILGPIVFVRAWYYWVATGPVPLAIAKALYVDPIGRTDIRVDGHCGRPAPEDPWICRRDSMGKRVVLDVGRKERAAYECHIAKGFLSREKFDSIHWCNTPDELEGATENAYVEQYHIDTEAGLRLFVDTIREHYGLPPEAV